jgi:hypothetical protein
VLEGVGEIRIEPGLDEELGGLQAIEAAVERVVGDVGDGPEEGEQHVLADDARRLEQALVLGREAIDPRGEHHLDRGRNLDRLDGVDQAIPSALAGQRAGLHERADGLLQEEWVAALDEERPQRRKARIVAEQGVEQLVGGVGR